jgi:hypothetical protein
MILQIIRINNSVNLCHKIQLGNTGIHLIIYGTIHSMNY